MGVAFNCTSDSNVILGIFIEADKKTAGLLSFTVKATLAYKILRERGVECGEALTITASQSSRPARQGRNSGTEKGFMPGLATITLNQHLEAQ